MDSPQIGDPLAPAGNEEAEALQNALKEKTTAEISDIGTLRKQLVITVPNDVIAEHLDHNFNELRTDAVVPGFRKGRAPMALVQKRFAADVRQSLTTTILGQSFFAVTEKNDLQVLGDPRFSIPTDSGKKLMEFDEALQHIKLPESGDFSYTCEVEVKPEFELPDLKGIEVKEPKIEIDDAQVQQQLDRQCKIRGRYAPIEEPAKQDDTLIADWKLEIDGKLVNEDNNVELGARGTTLAGISLPKLGDVLQGAKARDTRAIECEVPDDFEHSELRGKQGKFSFVIHEVKRLNPLTVADLVQQVGAESEQQLREFIKEDLEADRDRLIERARKEQILDFLYENTTLELPEELSGRQTERAVLRRLMEMQQSGVPQDEVAQKVDELRTTAREEVTRGLKLDFIMEKVAEALEVEVTDEEVNTEIARIARMYNQRFDKIRDDLHARGMLPQLADQIRQDKCVAKILNDAKLIPVEQDDSK